MMNNDQCVLSRDGLKWTRDETVLALGLYFQMSWGRIHSRSKEIVALAQKMGRTPSSLAMKMVDIGRCDPTLAARGVGGLAHGGKDEYFKKFDGFRINTPDRGKPLLAFFGGIQPFRRCLRLGQM